MQIQTGDELVRYDGKTLTSATEEVIPEGSGANNFGGFSRALNKLTFRRPDRSTYSINIPWITYGDRSCLENYYGDESASDEAVADNSSLSMAKCGAGSDSLPKRLRIH